MPALRLVWTEDDFGPEGWRLLHELARQRGRQPHKQARELVRYALDRARDGEDVELSQQRLEALLEPVA